jgi:hypothetical protein
MKTADYAFLTWLSVFALLLLVSCAPEKGPKGDTGEQGPPGETIIEVVYPCEVEYAVTLKTKKTTVVEKIEFDGTFCGMKISE